MTQTDSLAAVSAKTFRDTKIHALLLTKLDVPYVRTRANGRQKMLDTLRISQDLGVSRYTVYRFLNEEKLSKKMTAGLIQISNGLLTSTDLLPFLMHV